MYLIETNNCESYFNIALEEYLFKNYPEKEFLIIYVNAPSVIIGKHQNIYAEVDYPYIKQEGLVLLRRISGGGTVYHDLGNLNFTFINNVAADKPLADFKVCLAPINDFLCTLGLAAHIGEKNSILINGYKISGNAMHVYKKRRLYHGTLLFETNLKKLDKAIEGHEADYTSKAVSSNRSTVGNISDFLPEKISMEAFKSLFVKYFDRFYKGLKPFILNERDTQKIEDLIKEKYTQWTWNYAYSPDYIFKKDYLMDEGKILFEFSVSRGYIKEMKIDSEIANKRLDSDLNFLGQYLKGKKHEEADISEGLKKCKTLLAFTGKDATELSLFFF